MFLLSFGRKKLRCINGYQGAARLFVKSPPDSKVTYCAKGQYGWTMSPGPAQGGRGDCQGQGWLQGQPRLLPEVLCQPLVRRGHKVADAGALTDQEAKQAEEIDLGQGGHWVCQKWPPAWTHVWTVGLIGWTHIRRQILTQDVKFDFLCHFLDSGWHATSGQLSMATFFSACSGIFLKYQTPVLSNLVTRKKCLLGGKFFDFHVRNGRSGWCWFLGMQWMKFECEDYFK